MLITKLKGCDPVLVRKVEAIIKDLAGHGYDVRVIQGLRTQSEQDTAYSSGHSLVKHSKHQDGHAADLCVYEDGKPDWDAKHPAWRLIGRSAVQHGLIWGGSWKWLKDLGHVELPD